MLDSTYTGITRRVPKGEVPPTRYPLVPVGRFGRARPHRFHANLSRQVFRRHLAVAVHQHDQRLGVLVLHHQRLDYVKRVPAQHLGTVLRAAVLQVLVGVLGEGNLVGLQERSGWRFRDVVILGHDLYFRRAMRGPPAHGPLIAKTKRKGLHCAGGSLGWPLCDADSAYLWPMPWWAS